MISAKKRKKHKLIAIIMTFMFMITLVPSKEAIASTRESADGFYAGQALTRSDMATVNPIWYRTNNYNIRVSGATSGSGTLKLTEEGKNWGPGWMAGNNLVGHSYLKASNTTDWGELLNGNTQWLNSTSTTRLTPAGKMWSSGSPTNYNDALLKTKGEYQANTGSAVEHRHIRSLAANSGAKVAGYSEGTSGYINITTSKFPEAHISLDKEGKEGQTFNVTITGTSFALADTGNRKGIKLELYQDGVLIKTINKPSEMKHSETVKVTPKASGKYTYMLIVTDGVNRSGMAVGEINIKGTTPKAEVPGGSVQPPPSGGGNWSPPEKPYEPPEPPPPQPNNRGPIAEVSYPEELPRNYEYAIKDHSYDSDGMIVEWDWEIPSGCEVVSGLTNGPGGGVVKFKELGEYKFRLKVTDDGVGSNGVPGDPLSTSVEFTINVVNMPPTAKFTWWDEPTQGDDVTIKDYSSDVDGEIVERKWKFTPDDGRVIDVEPIGDAGGTVYFDKPGEIELELTVKDNDGMIGTYKQKTEVKPAIPIAYVFDDPYSKKQNRLVTFYGEYYNQLTGELVEYLSSTSSERYPIIWEQAQWTIEPITEGIDPSSIKIREDGDLSKRQVVFKEYGMYRTTLKVINTAGHWSEPFVTEFEVKKDEPPVADFFVANAFLRDADEDNPSKIAEATIGLVCASYSPDGDPIAKRVWKYKYDSNNDGSFDDETWVILDNGNNSSPELVVKDVGRYYFELEVTEGFDGPTLEEFISADDYLSANTDGKLMIEKVSEVINIAPIVSFDQIVKPKVDVVFTLGETSDVKKTSLSNNAAIFKSQLEAAGLDASVLSMNTSTVTSQTSFPWKVYNMYGTGFGAGDGQFNAVGKDFHYRGYGSEAPIDHLYYDDGLDMKREFTFDIDMTGYNACATIVPGFIFGATDNGRYTGYMAIMWHNQVGVYSFDVADHQYFLRNGAGQVAAAWWGIPDPSSFGGTQIALVSTKDTSLQKVFKMEYNDSQLKIFDGGTLLETVVCPPKGTAYGIAAINSSHGCGARSYMKFNNFKLTSGMSKTLDEVVKSHTWRTGSYKFVADLHDTTYQPEYLDKPLRIAVLFGELLSGEIDLSVLGTSANKTTGDKMILLNDGEGIFINNQNNMTAPLNTYADYVIAKVLNKQGDGKYLIVNEDELEIKTAYSDTENDPWIAERWKYQHDPDHFENPMGLANYHDVFIPDPITMFDKTGLYEVEFQRRDNPKDDIRFDNYRLWSAPLTDDKLQVYVHRKPVPQFSFKLADIPSTNNQSITIIENSFDLDNISKPERGIKSKEWYWKESTATTWNVGKPTQIVKNKSYLVKLIVEDYEGVKVQDVKAVVNSMNLPPVAKFIVDPNPAIAKKPFTITDLSYDPNGDNITQRQWRVKNPAGTWQDLGGTKPSQFNVLGLHVIELKVKDAPGLWSEPYTQDVMVNNLAPVAQFTMNPNPAATGETVTFADTSYDPNGDNIVERKWTLTDPLGNETEYINSMPPSTYTLVGDWIVTLEVKDEHGLWSAPTSRILIILNTPPHAQFTMVPNPAKINEIVTFTNLSWDTDGHSMSFDWDITRDGYGLVEMFSDGVKNTPYSFTKSFDIEGKYFIRLVVTDEFGAKGETIHSLIVWTPLEIVDSDLNPNPAQAGIRITATIQTDGYAESVKLTHNDPKLGIQVVNLEPSNVLPSKVNTWTGRFRTSPWIPDGAYPVYIEANRSGVTGISGPQTETKTLILNIEGTVYDDTRTTIKN